MATSPAPSHTITPEERKVIFASSLGTVFEWYDFYLYGSLAAIIAKQFFSGLDEGSAFIFARHEWPETPVCMYVCHTVQHRLFAQPLQYGSPLHAGAVPPAGEEGDESGVGPSRVAVAEGRAKDACAVVVVGPHAGVVVAVFFALSDREGFRGGPEFFDHVEFVQGRNPRGRKAGEGGVGGVEGADGITALVVVAAWAGHLRV